jgi:hypothetical protein
MRLSKAIVLLRSHSSAVAVHSEWNSEANVELFTNEQGQLSWKNPTGTGRINLQFLRELPEDEWVVYGDDTRTFEITK